MKILLINTKYLGDLIVSTPGIAALRKANPDAEIIFLLRKGYEEILINNPNIDRIISFDPGMKGNSSFHKLLEGIKLIKKIRDERFDVVIALNAGDRIAFWAWFSGGKIRIAPRKQSFGFLFNRKVNVEENSISYLEYYNKIIAEYIGNFDAAKTEFFINDADESWANIFLKENSICTENILIGIHPGASEPTKIWPVKYFIELIKQLTKKENVRILLIEGPQDKFLSDEIKSACTENEISHFLSTSISKTGALIKKCNIFVTHDTGTRHLSVALGTPVIALLPEDNLVCWNFYEKNTSHLQLTGKRIIVEKNSIRTGYLDGISVADVYNKITGFLNL